MCNDRNRKEIDINNIFSENTPGTYERLSRSTIGIAGAGGLGSNIAILLTRAGIGRLIIDDFDRVELKNLGRQAYTLDQIGMLKVDAIKENITNINPGIKVETYRVKLNETNISTVFTGVDILIEALDAKKAKRELITGFRKYIPDTPIIIASGVAGFGENDKIRTESVGNNVWVVGDQETGVKNGLMAPRVCIIAASQANLAVELIMNKEKITSSKYIQSFKLLGGG